MQESGIARVLRATEYAATKHAGQRRKNKAAEPYVNHVIEVANLLTQVGVTDPNVLCAALLHDVVEDCGVTLHEVVRHFGYEVMDLVCACSDDKTLPKVERKKLQIEHAKMAREGARLIKMADKLSNLSQLAEDPPVDWSPAVVRGYALWSMAVVNAMPYTNALLAECIKDKVKLIAGKDHVTPADLEAYYVEISK